jgi:hypothetical protein
LAEEATAGGSLRQAGRRPKQSLEIWADYFRYGLLTGHSQISNAECPLQISANAYFRPEAAGHGVLIDRPLM